MSVVIGIKKNNKIYMAADTQTSCGDTKFHYFGEDSRKITKFPNGILLGHTGAVHNIQIVCAHPEIFTLPEEGTLTKKYIVQNIIPKLYKCFRDCRMLERDEKDPPKMDNTFLLAHANQMFLIDKYFAVDVVGHYAAIGSGDEVAMAGLMLLDGENLTEDEVIQNKMAQILSLSASRISSVSGPFYVIDTANQEYKLIR